MKYSVCCGCGLVVNIWFSFSMVVMLVVLLIVLWWMWLFFVFGWLMLNVF